VGEELRSQITPAMSNHDPGTRNSMLAGVVFDVIKDKNKSIVRSICG
jgi:hypothetical protein